jgi:hypothetical protein
MARYDQMKRILQDICFLRGNPPGEGDNSRVWSRYSQAPCLLQLSVDGTSTVRKDRQTLLGQERVCSMGGARFIEHDGKRILFIDFGGVEFEDLVGIIRESKKLISKEPPGSVLTLTNVAGARVNPMTSKVLKEFTKFNKPYVKAGAVIGAHGLLKLEFDLVMKFTGRVLGRFDTPEEAKAWLISQ